MTLILASFGKLLVLFMLVWEYDVHLAALGIHIFVITSNITGIRGQFSLSPSPACHLHRALSISLAFFCFLYSCYTLPLTLECPTPPLLLQLFPIPSVPRNPDVTCCHCGWVWYYVTAVGFVFHVPLPPLLCLHPLLSAISLRSRSNTVHTPNPPLLHTATCSKYIYIYYTR